MFLLASQLMDTLMQALEIMWQGMLGIFIVIGIIALSVVVLIRTTSRKKKKKDASEEENQ